MPLLRSPGQRYIILAAVCALAILSGVGWALRQTATPNTPVETAAIQETSIARIVLGAPLNASELTAVNPRIRQQETFAIDTPIAMRVTSTAAARAPFTVGARLLDPHGQSLDLSPGQITLSPGESTFCCWRITRPGDYQLQLFRPEKVITSLPLKITRPL